MAVIAEGAIDPKRAVIDAAPRRALEIDPGLLREIQEVRADVIGELFDLGVDAAVAEEVRTGAQEGFACAHHGSE